MSENNKLEQKYKDMIRKMATRAGSVVSDSYRDLFIEMEQPHFQKLLLKTLINMSPCWN